jgi:hypothetical protein
MAQGMGIHPEAQQETEKQKRERERNNPMYQNQVAGGSGGFVKIFFSTPNISKNVVRIPIDSPIGSWFDSLQLALAQEKDGVPK